MSYKMSVDNLFEYRKVLLEELPKAELARDEKRIKAIGKRIAQILIMLDAAMLCTAEENILTITRVADPDFFDPALLRVIMPGAKMPAIGAGPTQVEIVFENESKQSNPGVSELETKIRELMSRNFVARIPEAVLLLQKSNPELHPADAWIRIKEMCQDIKIISRWDEHLVTQFIKNGPVVAFAQAKKNLPTWGDGEIARIINNAMDNIHKNENTPFSLAKEIQDAMEALQQKQTPWKNDLRSINMVKTVFGAENPGKTIGRIVAFIDPKKRAGMESKGRIPYVEKGY